MFAAEETEAARRPEEEADLVVKAVEERAQEPATPAMASSSNQTTETFSLVPSQQGFLLNIAGYLLAKNKKVLNVVYWHCIQRRSGPCPAFVKTTIVEGTHQ